MKCHSAAALGIHALSDSHFASLFSLLSFLFPLQSICLPFIVRENKIILTQKVKKKKLLTYVK